MIPITNEKVAGFSPRWADFRGFSLLFDNPGRSLKTSDSLAYLNCEVAGDPELLLYRAFQQGLERIGLDQLMQTYLFCPLPSSSYHVTVWDGLNAANIGAVNPTHRATCEGFLRELPCSLCVSELFVDVTTAKVSQSDWPIQFKLARVENWSNVSLVARLVPANQAAKQTLDRLIAARSELSAAFEAKFGIRSQETFVPHVTLGYFAHGEWAERVQPQLESWNAIFQEATMDLTLEVRRVSLYGFVDMATFFKVSQ